MNLLNHPYSSFSCFFFSMCYCICFINVYLRAINSERLRFCSLLSANKASTLSYPDSLCVFCLRSGSFLNLTLNSDFDFGLFCLALTWYSDISSFSDMIFKRRPYGPRSLTDPIWQKNQGSKNIYFEKLY